MEGVELVFISLCVGWLGGVLTKSCGISNRERAETRRDAVKHGFRVDGEDYICVKKHYGSVL